MIGQTQPSLTRFETGVSKSNRRLLLIATLLRVNTVWLEEGYGDPDDAPPPPGPVDDHVAAALRLFGQRVAAERATISMSRGELGLGVLTAEQVAEVEAGRLWPEAVALAVIALRLRQSLDYLVGGFARSEWRDVREDPALTTRFHDPGPPKAM